MSTKTPNLPVSSATVVVTVVNENEAPHFTEDPIQIVVSESVLPGTLLKSDIASDPDHSELRYDGNATALGHFYFYFTCLFIKHAVFVVQIRDDPGSRALVGHQQCHR